MYSNKFQPPNSTQSGRSFFSTGFVFYLRSILRRLTLASLLLASLLLVGCDRGNGSTAVITGRLESDGKPVFPAVVMLKESGAAGGGLSGNTSNDGVFKIYNVLPKNYQVAVEPIRLAGISKSDRAASQEPKLDPAGFPIREETIPDAFLNANIDFPEKYFKFETSGLNIDCSAGVPTDEVVLKLD